tara:strand:- start:129 stop:2999 length:2871 start_codon:yes stop_codon:yes gene_type:complete
MAKNTYSLIFEAVDKTSGSVKNIEKSVSSLDKKTKNANSALKRLGSIGGKVAGVLGKLALAGTATAGAFAFLAKRNLDALDALDKTAGKLGVSTKFLSEYAEVAKEAGLETTQFNVGLQRFLRRLGEAQQGAGTLVKPLKELGVSVKDSNGNFRAGTDVFNEYINKLSGVSNESAKLRLAFSAFDTEGVAFVNVANLGSEAIQGIREQAKLAGLSLGSDLTKAAAKANDALLNLIRRARGFSLQFFGALAPGIELLADEITLALDEAISGAGGMEAFAKDLAADFIDASSTFLSGAAKLFDGFTNSVALAGNVIKQLLVSLSGVIPGANFEFGPKPDKGALLSSLEVELAAAEAKVQKFSEDMGAELTRALAENDFTRLGAGSIQMFDGLTANVQKLKDKIKEVEEDTTIYFELASTGSATASEAVNKITDALEGQSDALRVSAEKAREEAEIRKMYPMYEDQVIRLAKAYQVDLDPAVNNSNEKQKKLNDTLNKQTSISTRVIEGIIQNDKNLQSLQSTLLIADEIARKFGISEKVLREELEKQIQAITGIKEVQTESNEVRAEATRSVSMFEQFMKDLIETSKASVREDMHKTMAVAALREELDAGRLNIDQFAEAMSRVKDITKETKDEIKETTKELSGFDKFMKDLSDRADAAVSEDTFRMMAPKEILAKAGTPGFSLDKVAKMMEMIGAGTKASDNKETLSTPPEPTEFQKFFKGIVEGAKSTVMPQRHAADALKHLNEQYKLGKVDLDIYNEASRVLNEQLKGTPTLADKIEDAFKSMSGSIASTFTDVIFGLKGGFEGLQDIALSVLRTIIQTMIQAFVQQQMASMTFGALGGLGSLGMMSGLGGFGLLAGAGMLLGGLFANGGNVASGRKPIIVGERGPELFLPGRSGQVVSNEQLNETGNQGDLTVNFNLQAIDTQTGTEFLLENKRVITGVVQDAFRRRAQAGPLG